MFAVPRPSGLPAPIAPVFDASLPMAAVRERIARAVAARTGVLISGEPGTGRRFVAAVIAAHDPAPARSVVLDCAAAAPDEIERQLFGVVRAPRANGGRRRLEALEPSGALCQACGGTLVLLNITDLAERTQARLARVLRDGEAVAGRRPVRIDVRPVACVEPGFDEAVAEGRVRADLCRTLSRTRIDVPPLRARREDIPALADHLLGEICAAAGVARKSVGQAALALLSALPYPGNVADLRRLLELLASRIASTEIALDDLLACVRFDGVLAGVNTIGPLRTARMRFEREYILEVLRQHQGRISEAARVLEMERTNLYRKMRALRISSPVQRGKASNGNGAR